MPARRLCRSLLGVLAVALASCATTPRTELRLSAPDRYEAGSQVTIVARSAAGGIRLVITDRRGTIHFDSNRERWEDDTVLRIHWVPPYNGVPPFRIEATDAEGERRVHRLRQR